MADLTIAELDLAAGLKPQNLVVPPMVVTVVLVNPPAELAKAAAKDKLILQKVIAASFASLEKAKTAFGDAMRGLDEGFAKKPPADKAEAEERVKTLNTVCKQIAEAQKGAAVAAATAEWAIAVKKNKDMAKYKIGFALRTTLGTIGIAASVTAAVLSMGTLAVTIVGAAKTVAGIAADIYNFCRDISKAEADIVSGDKALAAVWTDDGKTAGKVGRELASALGIPFVKSIVSQQKLLTEYNAKNAMKDKKAEDAWSKAKALMAEIEKVEKKALAAAKEKVAKLGSAVTKLLDEITALSGAGKQNDAFHKDYAARCDTYKAMQGGKLGTAATATGIAVLAAGLAATAKTVVEIAMTLA